MKILHLVSDHFYRFYSLGDFIKATILLVILHVLMVPFYIWAVQFIMISNFYVLLIILLGISLINIGYYIKATVCWILYVRRMKYLKKHNLLPDPNVDPIWTIYRPW